MSYKLGEEVILKKEYAGYPRGTKCQYLWHTRDSGYWVPLVVIINDDFKEMVPYTLKDYVQELDKLNNRSSIEYRLTTIKPNENEIVSLREAQNNLAKAESMLARAKEDLLLF